MGGSEQQVSQEALVHGVAGTMGATISMALTYPLVTVTTREQVAQKAAKGAKARSPLAAMLEIIKQEGVGALYSGIRPALFATAISMGIYFYAFQKLKTKLERFQGGPLGAVQSLLVGYVAGCINATLTNPMWVVTACMQAHKRQVKGEKKGEEEAKGEDGRARESVVGTVKEILRESGPGGFFKGLSASIILCVNPAIQWMVYEQLTQLFTRMAQAKGKAQAAAAGARNAPAAGLSSLQVFLIGAIAKVVATIMTYPYVMVKSRLQTAKKGGSGKKDGYQYTGIGQGLRHVYSTEGVAGLYRGLSTKILQSVLNTAFMFTIKEQLVDVAAAIVPAK